MCVLTFNTIGKLKAIKYHLCLCYYNLYTVNLFIYIYIICSCCDYIEISHGSFTQRYCHRGQIEIPATFTSSGTTMTVKFHTDNHAIESGFIAIICCDVNITTDTSGKLTGFQKISKVTATRHFLLLYKEHFLASTTTTTTSPPITTTTMTPPISNTSSSTCDCGLVQRRSRIIGGMDTQVNEYPWQVRDISFTCLNTSSAYLLLLVGWFGPTWRIHSILWGLHYNKTSYPHCCPLHH